MLYKLTFHFERSAPGLGCLLEFSPFQLKVQGDEEEVAIASLLPEVTIPSHTSKVYDSNQLPKVWLDRILSDGTWKKQWEARSPGFEYTADYEYHRSMGHELPDCQILVMESLILAEQVIAVTGTTAGAPTGGYRDAPVEQPHLLDISRIESRSRVLKSQYSATQKKKTKKNAFFELLKRRR